MWVLKPVIISQLKWTWLTLLTLRAMSMHDWLYLYDLAHLLPLEEPHRSCLWKENARLSYSKRKRRIDAKIYHLYAKEKETKPKHAWKNKREKRKRIEKPNQDAWLIDHVLDSHKCTALTWPKENWNTPSRSVREHLVHRQKKNVALRKVFDDRWLIILENFWSWLHYKRKKKQTNMLSLFINDQRLKPRKDKVLGPNESPILALL